MVEIMQAQYAKAVQALGKVYGSQVAAAMSDAVRNHANTRVRWAFWYQLRQAGWTDLEIHMGSGFNRGTISHGISRISHAIKYPSNGVIEQRAVEIATCRKLAAQIQANP